MKNQVRAYFREAKWLNHKYIPMVHEYMQIAIISFGYPLLATTSLVGMGDIVRIDSFEWLVNVPKVVRASTVIARLMDDMVSHKVLFYFCIIIIVIYKNIYIYIFIYFFNIPNM
jgi:(-)-germacrene D synthase